MAYPDLLAEKTQREGRPVLVALDRAPFHRAGAARERRVGGEGAQAVLPAGVLPAYCPRLNPPRGVA